MNKPQTKKELWHSVYESFSLALPHKIFTPGNSSPYHFIADAFFNPSVDMAAWSCRSGAKTLSASVIAALEYRWTDGLQSRVLSGSEDQAKFLYGYWQNWAETMPERIEGAVNRLLTRIAGGQFEILAASQKKVRGPKVQRLYQDEVDEIDTEIAEAAAGMLASRPDMPARTLYTSTWHRTNGLMGQIVKGSPGNGIKVHKWNVWEAISECPVERHENGKGCETCPMGSDCLRKAREFHNDPDRAIGIAAEACGLFQVDDAVKIWQKVSRESVDSEFLCKRPSPKGLVYAAFDESRHVVQSAPEYLRIYRAVDWGYNTFACLWLGVDKKDTVYLLDTYKGEQATISQHAEYLKKHPIQGVLATFCDPAGRNKNDQTGRSDIDEFRRAGIPCQYTLSPKWREVANGIRLIRSFLNPAGAIPRFKVVSTPANKAFLEDILSYENRKVNSIYIDEPKKPQDADHTMDALRYFFVNQMKPKGVMTGSIGM